MIVGCVKEIKKYEYRVGLTPENVKSYISAGHSVLIEKTAGDGSGFSDEQYAAAGAKLCDTPAEVYGQAEMIVKVKEPLEPEYDMIRDGQILFTYLHLAADKQLTDVLVKSGATSVAYETIRDANGGIPLLKPMSEIAGRLSIQEGAKCLEKPFGGRGVLLAGVPGVPRAKVAVLGGGVVGINACRIAVGIGADVTVVDNNLDRLTYLDDIFGNSIQTLYSTDAAIERLCENADLVIGAVLIPGGAAPKLVRREYLKKMKPGSVIVDIAVDQGGCCETTHPTYHDDPTFVVDGVVHYCVANMPGAVPRTSTIALTNATLRYGLAIASNGLKDACEKLPGILPGINTYKGKLTCPEVAQAFNIACEKVVF